VCTCEEELEERVKGVRVAEGVGVVDAAERLSEARVLERQDGDFARLAQQLEVSQLAVMQSVRGASGASLGGTN
jgi:hypothetical protein